MPPRPRRAPPLPFPAAALTTLPTLAVSKFWLSTNLTGNLSDDTKWSLTSTAGANNTTHPVDSDAVTLGFTDASARSITNNLSTTSTSLISLTLSNSSTGSVTLTQSPSAIFTPATLSLAGNNVTYSNQGALSVPPSLSIGTAVAAGTPTFSQAGGAVVAGAINVGITSPGVLSH